MTRNKISAVYKIVNTVTGDFYIGSSVNVMRRWREHRKPSTWKKHPNSSLYQDMQERGLDKFQLQILVPVMEEYLKQVEQELIEMLKPTYNQMYAKGRNVERQKASLTEYRHSEKGKAVHKVANKKYRQTEKGKEINRKQARKDMRKYINQLCIYNGETLTLNTLSQRFRKAGISHPTVEAKKYLINATN